MSFWNWVTRGNSLLDLESRGGKFALWWGKKQVLRHRPYVILGEDVKISPEARIHPRQGKIKLGAKCSVACGAVIQGNVEMGENCSVQMNSMLIGYGTRDHPDGRIQIGNHVRIAPNVQMIGGNHVIERTDVPISGQGLIHKPIIIEDDVWIAGRVVITCGVRIGTGSVIAAGAVVTKDVPPWSIVGGVPANVLRNRKPNEEIKNEYEYDV
ncbi:MAG: acyltransferase [Kiritimatiellia bacterium]